ncbi:MAG: hypothetical protein KGL12_10925 [Rhodospirillales bacterium]|nr:hypothetical protein [Rhodospirillales bacterium]
MSHGYGDFAFADHTPDLSSRRVSHGCGDFAFADHTPDLSFRRVIHGYGDFAFADHTPDLSFRRVIHGYGDFAFADHTPGGSRWRVQPARQKGDPVRAGLLGMRGTGRYLAPIALAQDFRLAVPPQRQFAAQDQQTHREIMGMPVIGISRRAPAIDRREAIAAQIFLKARLIHPSPPCADVSMPM